MDGRINHETRIFRVPWGLPPVQNNSNKDDSGLENSNTKGKDSCTVDRTAQLKLTEPDNHVSVSLSRSIRLSVCANCWNGTSSHPRWCDTDSAAPQSPQFRLYMFISLLGIVYYQGGQSRSKRGKTRLHSVARRCASQVEFPSLFVRANPTANFAHHQDGQEKMGSELSNFFIVGHLPLLRSVGTVALPLFCSGCRQLGHEMELTSVWLLP